jgi:hypothetical protein
MRVATDWRGLLPLRVLETTSTFLDAGELLDVFLAVLERKFVVFFGIKVLLREFIFDFLETVYILRSGDSSFSKSSKFL